jgi:hypothetical protein
VGQQHFFLFNSITFVVSKIYYGNTYAHVYICYLILVSAVSLTGIKVGYPTMALTTLPLCSAPTLSITLISHNRTLYCRESAVRFTYWKRDWIIKSYWYVKKHYSTSQYFT